MKSCDAVNLLNSGQNKRQYYDEPTITFHILTHPTAPEFSVSSSISHNSSAAPLQCPFSVFWRFLLDGGMIGNACGWNEKWCSGGVVSEEKNLCPSQITGLILYCANGWRGAFGRLPDEDCGRRPRPVSLVTSYLQSWALAGHRGDSAAILATFD